MTTVPACGPVVPPEPIPVVVPPEPAPLVVKPADRVTFHLAEYTSLKSEIAELVKQTSAYLTFAFGGEAALVAALIAHPPSANLLEFARWLPFALSFLFGSLSALSYYRTSQKSKYLRTLASWFSAEGLGWEKLAGSRPRQMALMHMSMWASLNGAGLYMGFSASFPVA